MTVVALNALKEEVKHYIDDADEKTVKTIHAMFEEHTDDGWWDSISDEFKAGIEEGIKDIEEGRVTPHEEVWKKYEKWQTK